MAWPNISPYHETEQLQSLAVVTHLMVSLDNHVAENCIWLGNLVEQVAGDDGAAEAKRGGGNLGGEERVVVEAMDDGLGLDLVEMVWEAT